MFEVFGRAAAWLPQGNTLPRDVVAARHLRILQLLWLHVPGLVLVAMVFGVDLRVHLVTVVPVAALAALGSRRPFDATSRRVWTSLGLLTCSASAVEISGGLIEAHFHFFVVVAVIALYQDWVVFGLAIAFVAGHHAVLGVLLPRSVFNHAMAQASPVRWALIHAVFVLAAAVAHVVAWRSSEQGAHDSLTGLASGAVLVRRLEEVLRRGPAAVLYLDLDGFKHVNDTLGHSAGDRLLVAAARRMELALREGDRLARLGGDEFAVLLPGADTAVAGQVAHRLVEQMTGPFLLPGGTGRIGVSVGVAASTRGGDAEVLMGQADMAMYAAKQTGKGRVALAG